MKINKFYLSDEYLGKSQGINQLYAFKKKRPVVLIIPEMFYESPAPCTYIRIFTPLLSTAFNSEFEVRIGTLKSATSILADVVIINRVPCEHASELTGFLSYLQTTETKLIYDIDDQLLDFSDSHPEAMVYSDRQTVVRELLSAADQVWVSTKPLAEAFGPLCKNIRVFENYLDLGLCEKYSEPRSHSCSDSKKFNILYMGSATHEADLKLVLDALNELYLEDLNINLYLIGVTDNTPEYSWIKVIHPPENASNNNYPEFMRWLRSLRIFDLGIAPLEDSNFNRCKSAIKFWDYSSMNIPTLASNVDAYNTLIIHGENGFLSNNNTASWYENLKAAMINKDQLDAIVESAKKTLKKLYVKINGTEQRKRAIANLLEAGQPNIGSGILAPLGDLPTREAIAEVFLCGNGIEIGALHNPLCLPSKANVKYVDRMIKEKLQEHYPELHDLPLVDVDIVDDGELLTSISDESQDFVIANHFLEHSEDPIRTLKNLLRVVKKGGVVYLAVPNMTKTFDCNRVETSLAHIIMDHEQGPVTSRQAHYKEWVSQVEPHFGKTYDGSSFDCRVEELMRQMYSIHFHCWSVSGFKKFLNYLYIECAFPFVVELFVDRGDEFVAILKKI